MDRVVQVRQALVARSKTATLDELKSQGKRSVKIVNAEQIAAMIAEAVETAVQSSGMFSPEQVAAMVKESRHEFKDILKRREDEAAATKKAVAQAQALQKERDEARVRVTELEAELQRAHEDATPAATRAVAPPHLQHELDDAQQRIEDLETSLRASQERIAELQEHIAELQAALKEAQAQLGRAPARGAEPKEKARPSAAVQVQALERQLEEARTRITELEAQLKSKGRQGQGSAQRELEQALARIAELQAELQEAQIGAAVTAHGAPPVSNDLLYRMMRELAELKAQARSGGQTPVAGATSDASLAAAIDKLSGSLNDRLDKFGRKIGISSAVEANQVKLDGLFNKDDDVEIESNMDAVQVKETTGGGIAANLERLKKLKKGS